MSVAAWRAGWLTVVVCVGFAAAGAAQGGPAETGAALQIVAGANGSALDAAVLRKTAADLAAKSPTFRQMLAAVGKAERLRVIRPVGSTRDLGEGRFVVDHGVTAGRLTVGAHRNNPTLRVRALAHELGHATEVACLPRQADTEELGCLITFRAGRDGWRGPVDTPFAAAMERVILRDLREIPGIPARTGASGPLLPPTPFPSARCRGRRRISCLFGPHVPDVNTQQRGAQI